MISLRFCLAKGCNGTLRAVQTGGYHNDTKVSKLRCNKCGTLACAIQFLAPIELMKYEKVVNSLGEKATAPRLRHAITVELDPHLKPEIKVHDPNSFPGPWL